MTFKNKDDYLKIKEDDSFNIINMENFNVESKIMLEIVRNNDVVDTIELSHTYNENQIDWFKAGSSLNLIAQNISNE